MSRKETSDKEEFNLLQWTSTDEDDLDISRKKFLLAKVTPEKLRKKRKKSHRNNRLISSNSSEECCGLKQTPMYLCWFEDLNGLRLNLVLMSFLLLVIFFVIFAVHLHSQIYNIKKTLVEERKLVTDNHHRYHNQIQDLMANQSQLTNNITILYNLLHNYSSQMTNLETSVSYLMKSLESAPELKNLPKDMQDAKKNLAKFGSHLTDLDRRVIELETKLTADVAKIAHSVNKSLHKRDEQSFESLVHELVQKKINPIEEDIKHLDEVRRIFATNITEQLKSQEINFAQNLKIMNELEDNMKNVTQANRKNEESYRNIFQKLQNFEEKRTTKVP
ncbi:unnamed protein product [Lepeophtheirus salmonis]|uniref:(salmon louse) hypothetical protein n=1 Tax=Lepeophtheirus salmonis TaxID=72036 RepID=A0A7R8D6F9_LEPSM|nr:unnamed protein product [Lepeophtheirus salmonis]CAF2989192.1 unnamed protein product [Lepeophtheirus salmonis]